MSLYSETLLKIKSLEIQGAENIAIAGVKAFAEKLKETQDPEKLKIYIAELSSLRATEPALKNALNYCLKNFKKDSDAAETVIKYFKSAKEKIAEIGAKKIQNNMTIFTHCHASTVTAILIKAHEQGKKFTVRNTETRPKLQGRKTAEELAAAGIPVVHGVDSTGRIALKECDLFLFGADAITAEGNVVNKIGTTMFAQFAAMYQIPVYSCTNSWKFDPATIGGADEPIEERDSAEVWSDAPAGIKIINPAFELTPADKINGIITELGVFKPETLVMEIKKTYPWMMEA
ncbi:ribose 1,5-bisphosphate isomerase [Candidatus Peregrinibacteria bacterium]|nr:ribose 1,5-bisphosphate isomerase [Candidatus Peregrinibacteria bacterium]